MSVSASANGSMYIIIHFSGLILALVEISGVGSASVSASYSQDKSVQQATSRTRSGKTSIAVTSTKCITYDASWVNDLDEVYPSCFFQIFDNKQPGFWWT